MPEVVFEQLAGPPVIVQVPYERLPAYELNMLALSGDKEAQDELLGMSTTEPSPKGSK